MSRLGRHQLCLLATMGSPFSLLILRDKVSRSIEERGLLAPRLKDGLFGITPAGLRALADALEDGELEPFFEGRYREPRQGTPLHRRQSAGSVMTTTVPTMKWCMTADGQWVRRCFDLTTTPQGKSDKPATEPRKAAVA